MESDTIRVRPEKQAIVEELRERLSASPVVILAENDGMNMARTVDLRRRLRGAQARLQVVPNGLFARAAASVSPGMAENLKGSTAAIFGADPVEISRRLWGFLKEHDRTKAVKRVLLSGTVCSGSVVEELAGLPPRPALLSIFLGTLNAPMRNLAGVLHRKLSGVVYVLEAFRSRREEEAR